MQITLKAIHHNARFSRETACFEADVYIDGVKAGTVSNDGNGGCNAYHPTSLGQALDAHAATLGTFNAYGMTLTYDADTVIGRVLDPALAEKQLARALATKIVFVRDGAIYSIAAKGAALRDYLARPNLPDLVRSNEILNLMPIGDALAVWERHAAQGAGS